MILGLGLGALGIILIVGGLFSLIAWPIGASFRKSDRLIKEAQLRFDAAAFKFDQIVSPIR